MISGSIDILTGTQVSLKRINAWFIKLPASCSGTPLKQATIPLLHLSGCATGDSSSRAPLGPSP